MASHDQPFVFIVQGAWRTSGREDSIRVRAASIEEAEGYARSIDFLPSSTREEVKEKRVDDSASEHGLIVSSLLVIGALVIACGIAAIIPAIQTISLVGTVALPGLSPGILLILVGILLIGGSARMAKK